MGFFKKFFLIFVFSKYTFSISFLEILEHKTAVKVINTIFAVGFVNTIKNFWQYRNSENYKILDFSLPKIQKEEFEKWFSMRIYNMLLFANMHPKNCTKNNLLIAFGLKDFFNIDRDEERARVLYGKIIKEYNDYQLYSVDNIKKLLFYDSIHRERRASAAALDVDEHLKYASYWHTEDLFLIQLDPENIPNKKDIIRCLIADALKEMERHVPFLFNKVYFVNDLIYSLITIGNIVQALAIVVFVLLMVIRPTHESSLLQQSFKLWKYLPIKVKELFSFKKIL